MEFNILNLWNGDKITHKPVCMQLEELREGIGLNILAPFFDDPAPTGKSGEPMWQLWEYEGICEHILWLLNRQIYS